MLVLEIYLNTNPPTQEVCFSLSWNSIISTASTIAPTRTEVMDIRGRGTRSFEDIFENLVTPGFSLQTYPSLNGSVFLFISSSINNRMSNRFGLEEPYSDCRVQIKVYDNRRGSLEQPLQYWKAETKEMDLSVSRNSQIYTKIETLFKRSKFEAIIQSVQTVLKNATAFHRMLYAM